MPIKTATGAQRYNNKMDKIFNNAKKYKMMSMIYDTLMENDELHPDNILDLDKIEDQEVGGSYIFFKYDGQAYQMKIDLV